jgi:hypothetical protein
MNKYAVILLMLFLSIAFPILPDSSFFSAEINSPLSA